MRHKLCRMFALRQSCQRSSAHPHPFIIMATLCDLHHSHIQGVSLHLPVLTTCVLASSKVPTGGSFTAAFHNLPLRSERTSLSGHHITFRLRPSSRSFVMFMITTGRTAPPCPRQLQLHLLGPPPFPLTASISVFYDAQRLHLFEGPTKNAVHKTENCRI